MTTSLDHSKAPAAIDPQKRDAFAERMLGIVNAGGLSLMTSIGHRTGLFDVMAELPPSTSPHIADVAGLNERYVREWLGAMVVGRIVEYDPEHETYFLPREHAACLTRAASPENLAVFTQFFAVLGQVEDKIVDCFRNGGGVPYSEFDRFHDVMAEESAQTTVAGLTDHILPLVPDLTEALKEGIAVLDVGCGSGRAMNFLARRFPNSRFCGYDFSAEAVETARAEARQHGLTNVRFEVKDVTSLGETGGYDLITAFDAIHDQADPHGVLRGISGALRADGTFLMQDIATSSHVHKNMEHPIGPMLYTISCMHCMTVSLAQGGAGLGTCWGEELAREMLQQAGFRSVDVHRLPHDFQNCYYVARIQ